MGLLCSCPPAAEIPDVTLPACFESVGQIQKLFFQRVYSSGTTKNSFTIATANPNVLASWTPLLAAADGTKVVQTPFIEGPTNEAGDPRTFGGGNETLGGVEKIIGRLPTTFEARFDELPQYVVNELKDYQCEKIAVYFIDEHNRIIGLADTAYDGTATPTSFFPIPLAERSLFIGDKTFGGLEAIDSNAIRFQLLPNWSDYLYIVTPTDFSPLDNL